MLIKFFKSLRIIFIIFVLVVFLILLFSQSKIYEQKDLKYGVTFSKKQAIALGLNWQNVYNELLDDLQVKRIRIPSYWDEIEKSKDTYTFSDLDWQIKEAQKRNAQVILVVGARQPRWPECHIPTWANEIEATERNQEILQYVSDTVNRYKDYENIYAWQVENEFFLTSFGECPKFKTSFLEEEIALVRSIDPERPIVITDSGELSLWVPAAKRADIFGTSIYLNTFSSALNSYVHYPITPGFFRFKKNMSKIFAHPKDWIVIELQAEPWGPIPYQEMSETDRARTMDLEKFKNIINFSHQAGFKDFYLWGVEWWYWEKETNNNPALWEEAKKLFIK